MSQITDGLKLGNPKVYKGLFTQLSPSTLTSGTLYIGARYTITLYVAGDDFSNIATVESGIINTTGCVFIAKGELPTVWSNMSVLYSDAAPYVKILENTIGDIKWSYIDVGGYQGTLVNGFGSLSTNFACPEDQTACVDSDKDSAYFLYIQWYTEDSIFILTFDEDLTRVDNMLYHKYIEFYVYD